MDAFRPGASSVPSSTVELSVSCRNLMDMDIFSKSDPVVVLFVNEFGRNNWVEYDRTEVIDNNLNPDFVKKFVMDYFFEERQCLKFEVYDVDSASKDLRKHEEVTLQFQGRKLDKKDWFGKSDPFLAIYRVNEDTTYTIVHRTEVIKNTLNPNWNLFTVPVRNLCCNDYNRSLLIKCFDWNKDGSEDLIGEFQTNLQQLSESVGQTFQLINSRIAAKKGSKYSHSGVITVVSLKTRRVHSLLDYVHAGTQLNCTVAIDFTASNGNPTNPSSLHYINPYQPNQYMRAIRAVGEIIQDYDTDKFFPVLGFGARLPPNGIVSHEFFVNGDAQNPHCFAVEGIMEAYRKCISSVQLYGPTNFAPVINHVARFAAAKHDGSEYFILLILTDGVITDMPQTTAAIVQASTLPLSIIIVGVGNADFDAMNELDGDDVRLQWNGKYAARDIVQFVPFREFIKGNSQDDLQISQARLAKEVLAEIPDQFLSFMKVNSITPGSWSGASRPGS